MERRPQKTSVEKQDGGSCIQIKMIKSFVLVALIALYWGVVRIHAGTVQVPAAQGWFEVSDDKFILLANEMHEYAPLTHRLCLIECALCRGARGRRAAGFSLTTRPPPSTSRRSRAPAPLSLDSAKPGPTQPPCSRMTSWLLPAGCSWPW